MTSIFEGQPTKKKPFPSKTRVIWVLGAQYVFIYLFIYLFTYLFTFTYLYYLFIYLFLLELGELVPFPLLYIHIRSTE